MGRVQSLVSRIFAIAVEARLWKLATFGLEFMRTDWMSSPVMIMLLQQSESWVFCNEHTAESTYRELSKIIGDEWGIVLSELAITNPGAGKLP